MSPRSVHRCAWAESDPLLVDYHDREWGVPQRDARALWGMLLLEGFQAGLSWLVVLRKREGFLRAFKDLDPLAVARFTERDVDRLVNDEGIIRSRAKIVAAIGNARAYLAMEKASESFSDFVWSFVDGVPVQGGEAIVASTPASVALSKGLKKRGFKFVGPVIVYAFMQAVGLVNDHARGCFRREAVAPRSKSRARH